MKQGRSEWSRYTRPTLQNRGPVLQDGCAYYWGGLANQRLHPTALSRAQIDDRTRLQLALWLRLFHAPARRVNRGPLGADKEWIA
jgi:hypothetical protein